MDKCYLYFYATLLKISQIKYGITDNPQIRLNQYKTCFPGEDYFFIYFELINSNKYENEIKNENLNFLKNYKIQLHESGRPSEWLKYLKKKYCEEELYEDLLKKKQTKYQIWNIRSMYDIVDDLKNLFTIYFKKIKINYKLFEIRQNEHILIEDFKTPQIFHNKNLCILNLFQNDKISKNIISKLDFNTLNKLINSCNLINIQKNIFTKQYFNINFNCNQLIMFNNILKGKNINVNGIGGTGKSYVVKQALSILKNNFTYGNSVLCECENLPKYIEKKCVNNVIKNNTNIRYKYLIKLFSNININNINEYYNFKNKYNFKFNKLYNLYIKKINKYKHKNNFELYEKINIEKLGPTNVSALSIEGNVIDYVYDIPKIDYVCDISREENQRKFNHAVIDNILPRSQFVTDLMDYLKNPIKYNYKINLAKKYKIINEEGNIKKKNLAKIISKKNDEETLRDLNEIFSFNNTKKKKIIWLDESSMVQPEKIYYIDLLSKINNKSLEDYGGNQMIFTGDVCQLKPIKPFYDKKFYEIVSVKNMKKIKLNICERTNDFELKSFIENLNNNKNRDDIIKFIEDRKLNLEGYDEESIYLTSLKTTKKTINESIYKNNKNNEHYFKKILKKSDIFNNENKINKKYLEKLAENNNITHLIKDIEENLLNLNINDYMNKCENYKQEDIQTNFKKYIKIILINNLKKIYLYNSESGTIEDIYEDKILCSFYKTRNVCEEIKKNLNNIIEYINNIYDIKLECTYMDKIYIYKYNDIIYLKLDLNIYKYYCVIGYYTYNEVYKYSYNTNINTINILNTCEISIYCKQYIPIIQANAINIHQTQCKTYNQKGIIMLDDLFGNSDEQARLVDVAAGRFTHSNLIKFVYNKPIPKLYYDKKTIDYLNC
jgi:hypothetical protein